MNIESAVRTKDIKLSGIRIVSDKAAELRKKGKSITDLTIGRPNYDTPSHIKDAAVKALKDEKVHYTSNYGILELRQALSLKMNKENDLQFNPDEIIITAGGEEALAISVFTFINPGDEVIIPEPSFVSYASLVKLSGGIPVFVSMENEEGFGLDYARIEKAINPKTKAIIFASPNNPTGTLFSKEDMQFLADIAIKHNLLIISDEVYEKIIFDGKEHISIGSLPNMRNRVITCNSLSKTYSMTGWRIGYAAADKKLIADMLKIHQGFVTCANSIAQWAALEAVAASQKCVEEMSAEYARRRDYLIDQFKKVKKLNLIVPDGSIFAFVDIRKLGMTSARASDYFLDEAEVAMVPGDAFGPSGEGYLRLSFGCSLETLEEAMAKINRTLK